MLAKKLRITQLLPQEVIAQKIFLLRGHRVMLDKDLAVLYEVEVKQLTRQVRRNISRFPCDFMFQLTKEEYQALRCQFGTLKKGQHRKYLPYAFTEQGVAMLSSVLSSERAAQVNIAIMRIFVRLREILYTHKELAQRLVELEKRMTQKDEEIQDIFSAIRQLMSPKEKRSRVIKGFRQD